jgi:hypothetical protein
MIKGKVPPMKINRQHLTKDDEPAEAYARPHTMTGKDVSIESTMGAGYPDEAKTSGIVVRGTHNQTKGRMARGPMA